MSLEDARQMLRWNTVMEALVLAKVDAETIEMVKGARDTAIMVHSMASALLICADRERPRNYIKVDMVGMLPPFDRAYIELIRPGGKTSHELRELLRDRLMIARRWISDNLLIGEEDRSKRIQAIDDVLAVESP